MTEDTKNTKNTKDTKDTKFRITAKKIFITIKDHHDDEFIKFIADKFPIKRYIYCNEKGDSEHGYNHTHAAIEFINKINIKDPRTFDYKGIHPDIQTIRSWDASVTYCMKEGTYKANFVIKEKPSLTAIIDNITKAPSVIDALKENASSLKDIVPIVQIYNNKGYMMPQDLLDELKQQKFNLWQQQLFDMLHNHNDRRCIFWLYEKVGGIGKTYFCDMLEAREMHETLVIAATGSLRDIADLIRNWMDGGNTPKYILIDLPRTFEDRESIYTVLESLKNGRLTCTKYKGATLRFRSPAVCVFSNWKPQVDKCSLDRWRILTVNSINDPLIPVTLGDKDSTSE